MLACHGWRSPPFCSGDSQMGPAQSFTYANIYQVSAGHDFLYLLLVGGELPIWKLLPLSRYCMHGRGGFFSEAINAWGLGWTFCCIYVRSVSMWVTSWRWCRGDKVSSLVSVYVRVLFMDSQFWKLCFQSSPNIAQTWQKWCFGIIVYMHGANNAVPTLWVGMVQGS